MSTLKVGGIRGTTASSDAITVNASDGTATGKFTNLPNRNLIINGSMLVAQRGTSSTTSGYGSVDRWKISFGGTDEAVTHAQVALTSSDTGPWAKGFRKALQLTNGNQTGGAGAADYIEVDQEIEAQNIVQSGWDYTSTSSHVTLSFWIKSSVAQNFYGYLRVNDNTKQLYCFETGALTAGTWTKITKTIPGAAANNIDNDIGAGILLRLLPFYGTDMTGARPLNAWAAYDSAARTPDSTSTWYTTNDSTFAITGVQLEVGDFASNFEHRSYSDELDKCERYYQVIATDIYDPICCAAAFAGDMVQGTVHFHKPFRDEPSMVKAGGTNWLIFRYSSYGSAVNNSQEGDDFNLQQVSETMANIRFTSFDFGDNNKMGSGGLLYTQNASALLAFSSEL
jgi:hypothetical protein